MLSTFSSAVNFQHKCRERASTVPQGNAAVQNRVRRIRTSYHFAGTHLETVPLCCGPVNDRSLHWCKAKPASLSGQHYPYTLTTLYYNINFPRCYLFFLENNGDLKHIDHREQLAPLIYEGGAPKGRGESCRSTISPKYRNRRNRVPHTPPWPAAIPPQK